MAFGNVVKYGSVTLDFVVICAKNLGLDMAEDKTLRVVLHQLGFQVSTLNKTTGEYKPCHIDRMADVNVRCQDRPYMYRKTTVFSGILREEKDFPNVGIYDKVDILDVSSAEAKDFVNSLDFDIPSVEKVNTRKYTKRDQRSDSFLMDLPEIGDSMDEIFGIGKGF